MINTDVWAEIRRLFLVEKLKKSEIARRLEVDRKTVRRALASEKFPAKHPIPRPSKLDPYKPYLLERIREYPTLSATLLQNEIVRFGYTGEVRILQEYLKGLRESRREVFLRLETLPGEYAQVDWANCGTVKIGTAIRKLSCFVMVLSYSRMMYLAFTLSQCIEDFISCHIHAFQFFGGIPKKILYDNLKTVVLSRVGRVIHFNPQFLEFSGIYRFEAVPCNPGRGNEKGKVERGIQYIRGSFLAAHPPESTPFADLQKEGDIWRDTVANVRLHGTTQERPIDRFQKEQSLLQALPEKGREYDARIIRAVSASSQALIHFDSNRYSVPHRFAYQTLTLKAGPNTIEIIHGQEKIATHTRSMEKNRVMEDPKHVEGILATKRRALETKLLDAFQSMGEMAKQYLDQLILSEWNAPYHIGEIMKMVKTYGKTEVLQAIDHALQFNAWGSSYLKNIIHQQRARRGESEKLPLIIPRDPSWEEISLTEADLALYDKLFGEEGDPEADQKQDGNEKK